MQSKLVLAGCTIARAAADADAGIGVMSIRGPASERTRRKLKCRLDHWPLGRIWGGQDQCTTELPSFVIEIQLISLS